MTLTKADPQPTPVTSPALGRPLIQHYEQAECPACESAIRTNHVFRKLNPKEAYEPVRREVNAYCQACTKVWHVHQTLRMGVWVNESDVREVVDQRTLNGVMRRVAGVDGDIRVEALAG